MHGLNWHLDAERPASWLVKGWSVGLAGLAPAASSLSEICTRACFPRMAPATWANDALLETVANRSAPMACGPGMPARGGSGAPPGGPWLARQTPAGCPRQASPRLGDRLVRGSPGGVWARDIPLYRRAVPASMVVPLPPACLTHTHQGGCLGRMARCRNVEAFARQAVPSLGSCLSLVRCGPWWRHRSCRLLVVEQPAVVNVSDDLRAVGGGVEAVEAQHHRLRPHLELAVPPERVGTTGVVDVLEAHRLRVGPGQGDVWRVLGE
jgi:hypothetical protein